MMVLYGPGSTFSLPLGLTYICAIAKDIGEATANGALLTLIATLSVGLIAGSDRIFVKYEGNKAVIIALSIYSAIELIALILLIPIK